MSELTRRCCIAFVTLSICARAELPPEKLLKIEQVVATEMARASIPGISLTIATGGAIQWSGGYGMADLENFVQMTAAPSCAWRRSPKRSRRSWCYNWSRRARSIWMRPSSDTRRSFPRSDGR